jgi:hypothetical protein
VSDLGRQAVVWIYICDLNCSSMAPKKRKSTGEIKTNFVALSDVKPGQVVSVKGKVMTKTGVMIFGCTSSYSSLVA